jgi:hypothetical protein
MTKQFQINIPVTITEEQIENIIVGALEGGSNYWYLIGEGIPPQDESGRTMSERITHEIINNPEYKLAIHDLEDEEGEPLGYLTQEGMIKAFEIVATNYNWHYQNLINEEDDAETHDVFFQCAVMGEIVFG